MTTEKIQEIAQLFIDNQELTPEEVMNGYIFGTYSNNEHYLLDEITNIKNTVVTLTTPEVVETPIETIEPVTESIPEPTIEEVIQEILP